MMNKYMGFYELRFLNIPTVKWQEFTENTTLDEDMLWTLRVAVEKENDFNLPRFVGVTADEAYKRGRELLEKYRANGIVICYPYFIAEKSGVMDIRSGSLIVEAVEKDLWNLVTYGRKNVTINIKDDEFEYSGEKEFLTSEEIDSLIKNAGVIRHRYRDIVNEGGSIIAEWSFAYNTNTNHEPKGDRYLVFYEIRSI